MVGPGTHKSRSKTNFSNPPVSCRVVVASSVGPVPWAKAVPGFVGGMIPKERCCECCVGAGVGLLVDH